MPVERVKIEGLRETTAAFKRLGGAPLGKEVGAVHKRIGEMVIARAGGAQTGVGSGTGATIRPSANTREVQLRVGGSFRAQFRNKAGSYAWRQWGVNQILPPPGRPYLIGAAREIQDEIYEAYLDGINKVAGKLAVP